MFDIITNLASHIAPFLGVMGQVVTIWGFLNFINQLNLQNLTLVADRALGRLPGLKNAIFILKTGEAKDAEESLDQINEITKRLSMDLKQLGIAQTYDMKQRINLLSQQNVDINQLKKNYLDYELGSGWSDSSKNSANMVVPFIQNIENELLNIFDLSHAGQTFMTHLSTNVIRVSWFSLVVYLIECDIFTWAGYLFVLGIVLYFVSRFIMNRDE